MAIIWGHGWMSKEVAQKNGYTAWKRFWHNVGCLVTFRWHKNEK